MIKVSVIVPVYNVEKYLRKCLNSLVNQTLQEIEILVINDGSNDDSQVIIDEFKAEFPLKIKSFVKPPTPSLLLCVGQSCVLLL